MFLDKVTERIFLLGHNHEQTNEQLPGNYARCHRV